MEGRKEGERERSSRDASSLSFWKGFVASEGWNHKPSREKDQFTDVTSFHLTFLTQKENKIIIEKRVVERVLQNILDISKITANIFVFIFLSLSKNLMLLIITLSFLSPFFFLIRISLDSKPL